MGLEYREYPPTVRLRDYVECFWSVFSGTGGTVRILPDGCMDIVASLAPRQCVRVVGTMTRHRVSRLSPEVSICGVRFHPGILPALLRVDGCEFADVSVEPGKEVRKRFAAAESVGAFIRAVEDWLAVPPAIQPAQRAIAWAWRHNGAMPVPEAASHADLSDRQFRRVAVRLLGITPKQLARIARFRLALREGHLQREETWARIAVDCGYYDQSHLTRDFAEFAGVAPGRFFQDMPRPTVLT